MSEHKPVGISFEAWVNPDGSGFLNRATYMDMPCGCRVTGNGTIPNPLKVEHCPIHIGLVEACKMMLESFAGTEENVAVVQAMILAAENPSPNKNLLKAMKKLWPKKSHRK